MNRLATGSATARAGTALLAGLSLVTACSVGPQRSQNGDREVTITAREGNRRLLAIQADTEAMIGRKFTTYQASSGPENCERPDGSDGFSFFIPGRKATIDADPPDLVTQIDTFWRAKGLTVLRSGPIGNDNDLYEVAAVTADHGSLIANLGRKTKILAISGETGCAKEVGT